MELISIITPVHNSADFIGDTILSVVAQTYDNWELLIVDDASTDNSLEIIKSFSDSRIKLIVFSVNHGAAHARNAAIEASKGRYVSFLDADDTWHATKLEKQLDFIKSKNCAIVHCAYETMSPCGEPSGKIIRAPSIVGYKEILNYCYIGCLTAMYDKHLIGDIRMPDLRKRQDYAFWISILREGHLAYFQNEVLASYRTGMSSLSNNKFSTIAYNWNVLRKVARLSFPRTLWHFFIYSCLGLRKYYWKF